MALKIRISLYLTFNTKSSQISRTFLWPFSETFGLVYSPLNSAKLSCLSEVTLGYLWDVFVSTLLQKVYFLKYIFEFFRLEKRVDRMEKSIGSIVTKIDAVLAKLETMERGKNKRKQKMTEILGTITENDGSESFM